MSLLRLVIFTLLVQAIVILAQTNSGESQQVDPNASCAQSDRDRIQSCLDRVEQDESRLPGGPCTSTDWTCICTKQQGMVDCYSPCSGLQPVDMIDFNQNNCKGQHFGITITGEGGSLTYTWSSLGLVSTTTSSPNITGQTASSSSQEAAPLTTGYPGSSSSAASATTTLPSSPSSSSSSGTNSSTGTSQTAPNGSSSSSSAAKNVNTGCSLLRCVSLLALFYYSFSQHIL